MHSPAERAPSLPCMQVLAFSSGLAALAPFLAFAAIPARYGASPATAPGRASPRDESEADATVADAADEADGGQGESARDSADAAAGSSGAAAPRLSFGQLLRNVLARAPDGTDLAHAHFCKAEQILEDGPLAAALHAAPAAEPSLIATPAHAPAQRKKIA